MKKTNIKLLLTVFTLCVGISFFSTANAQVDGRGKYGGDPMTILDAVVKQSQGNGEIQETMLNTATDTQGGYAKQYKIANTLDYLRKNIAPYLQWATYIGLIVAVILIIYNGFLMVTNSLHKQGDIAKVKANLMNITIGVLLLTGFYALIRIVVGLINSIFGSSGGTTGF